MNPFPKKTYGECSTGDITYADSQLLDRDVLPTIYRNEYGYMIYVQADKPEEQDQSCRDDGFSEKFLQLLAAARTQKLRYIQIEQDNELLSDEIDPSWDAQ